ncbi:MAG: hypothetical protein LBR16_08635, partial [Treponema sp.]|nr:hypothetical protein [Treponema sp.]
MKKCTQCLLCILLCLIPAGLPARSFDDLFPSLNKGRKAAALTPGGLIHSAEQQSEILFLPAAGAGIDL